MAMSGGGANCSSMIYFPIRWNSFTILAAQSLVAVTRGVCAVWMMAPSKDWPATAWMGKFFAPSNLLGGYAGTLPRGSGGVLVQAVLSGLWQVGLQRRIMCPSMSASEPEGIIAAVAATPQLIGLHITAPEQFLTDGVPPHGFRLTTAVPARSDYPCPMESTMVPPGDYFLCPRERPISTEVPVFSATSIERAGALGLAYTNARGGVALEALRFQIIDGIGTLFGRCWIPYQGNHLSFSFNAPMTICQPLLAKDFLAIRANAPSPLEQLDILANDPHASFTADHHAPHAREHCVDDVDEDYLTYMHPEVQWSRLTMISATQPWGRLVINLSYKHLGLGAHDSGPPCQVEAWPEISFTY